MADLRSLIHALQGSFDSLMGTIRELAGAHNVIVDDVQEIADQLNEVGLEIDGKAPSTDHPHANDHVPATEGTGIDISGQVISVDLSELAAGGELGGTLDAPTVDASHSGSTHASLAHPNLATHDALGLATDAELAAHAGSETAHAMELDDLTDVDAPTPADADVLTWVDADGEWQAAAPTGGSGGGSNAFAFFIS